MQRETSPTSQPPDTRPAPDDHQAATVRASELLRVLQGGGRPTPPGRTVAELGRITKTLLAYLVAETYRRRILTQLNRTESRQSLARALFHGQLRQRYHEGQEDQLGALVLVLNANTATPPG